MAGLQEKNFLNWQIEPKAQGKLIRCIKGRLPELKEVENNFVYMR